MKLIEAIAQQIEQTANEFRKENQRLDYARSMRAAQTRLFERIDKITQQQIQLHEDARFDAIAERNQCEGCD